MGDGSLTFVVPVRDPRGVEFWDPVKHRIGETVRSLLSQLGPAPSVVLSVSPGTDLPRLPARVQVVEADVEFRTLPAGDLEPRREAIRADKGRRAVAALTHTQPRGHVMVADYDDLVSNRLSSMVAEHPDAHGWYVESGYLWDGGRFAMKYPEAFDRLCGTSLLVRHDLLDIPRTTQEVDLTWVKDTLGSHIRLRPILEDGGTPLAPLGFPGAVYRIGTGVNASGVGSLRGQYFGTPTLLRPRQVARLARRLIPWSRLAGDFAGPGTREGRRLTPHRLGHTDAS